MHHETNYIVRIHSLIYSYIGTCKAKAKQNEKKSDSQGLPVTASIGKMMYTMYTYTYKSQIYFRNKQKYLKQNDIDSGLIEGTTL